MNDRDRIEYLKQKRAENKNRIVLEKKENALNLFLTQLNEVEPKLARVVSLDLDIENIVSPTLINKPEKPIYNTLRFRTIEDESNVKNHIRNWITEQKSDKILIKNEFLIKKTDWLEINTKSVLQNFELLFEKLDLIYTIIFTPENGNFINSFEFEFDVTIYKGNLYKTRIKYYS